MYMYKESFQCALTLIIASFMTGTHDRQACIVRDNPMAEAIR